MVRQHEVGRHARDSDDGEAHRLVVHGESGIGHLPGQFRERFPAVRRVGSVLIRGDDAGGEDDRFAVEVADVRVAGAQGFAAGDGGEVRRPSSGQVARTLTLRRPSSCGEQRRPSWNRCAQVSGWLPEVAPSKAMSWRVTWRIPGRLTAEV